MKFAFISDIHFGALNSKKLYKELHTNFIKKIMELDDLDIIIIGGDLFHKKLSLNELSSKYAILFMNNLVKIANKNHVRVRILKGTLSHDLDQLDNFKYLEKSTVNDIRIIEHVCSEEIDGVKILYIPEEYMDNKDHFYKDYLDKEHDVCFLHGTFEHIGFVKYIKHNTSRSPIFSIKDFSNVKGPVICGHIHARNEFKNKIFYSGSFSRWCFGEEDDKGFYIFDYNPKNNKFKTLFMINTLADKYVNLDEKLFELFPDTDSLLAHINQYKKDNNISYVKFKIKNKDILSNSIVKQTLLANKIEVDVKIKREERDDENESLKKFSFLFGNTSIVEKISEYIKLTENGNANLLTEDAIEELLSTAS